MRAKSSVRAAFLFVAFTFTVSGCAIGLPPLGQKTLDVLRVIKIKRPPAGELPREGSGSMYSGLLREGYVYIGYLEYKSFQLGATETSVRKAMQKEAQKFGAEVVWLYADKSTEYTTYWQKSSGMSANQRRIYISGTAHLFALEQKLAAEQLRDLEMKLAAFPEKKKVLQKKIIALTDILAPYAQSHRGENTVNASLVALGRLKAQLEAPAFRFNDVRDSIWDVVAAYKPYWVNDPSTTRPTGIIRDCGDKKALLEGILDAYTYFVANENILAFVDRPYWPQ